MPEIISIGSALVDIFIHSGHFQLRTEGDTTYLCQMYGDKIEIDDFKFLTGGGGSNTAVGFARQGFETGIVSETGQDVWSNFVLDELKSEQVSTKFIQVEKKETTGGSVILVGKDGGRTVMVHRGAASMLDPTDMPIEALKTARWIHLSSISGRADTLKTLFAAVAETQSTAASTGLSWNPGKRELKLIADGWLNLTDVPATLLFVNKQEWEQMANQHQAARDTFQQIIITNGKHGGQVYTQDWGDHSYDVQPVEAIDETGAGDAFAVGYVSAYLRGEAIDVCSQAGAKNAASVVQQFGAKPGLLRAE